MGRDLNSKVTDEEMYQCKQMLDEGCSIDEIAFELDRAYTTVRRMAATLRTADAKAKAERTEMSLYKWLKENWQWKQPEEQKILLQHDGKYRIVKKGEKGHLRTPYRPDGIFR